jgi:CHASE3 domain sensor protein
MERLRRTPMRIKIASVGVLVLFLMVIAVGLTQASQQSLLRVIQEGAELNETNNQIDNLLTSLVNMETGARGYVITRKAQFLEPYDSGLDTYPLQLSALKDSLAHDPGQALDSD